MNLLFFNKKKFLSKQEIKNIQETISIAEKETSGEIRIFIERKNKLKNPLEKAKEVFVKHKMDLTKQRNGILVYITYEDKKVAIYGDEGIHHKVKENYWQENINDLIAALKNKEYEKGISHLVLKIGQELKKHFPYDAKTDTNELSNEIIFH